MILKILAVALGLSFTSVSYGADLAALVMSLSNGPFFQVPHRPGNTIGHLRVVTQSVDLNKASSNDILVLRFVPETIPNVKAILFDVPQSEAGKLKQVKIPFAQTEGISMLNVLSKLTHSSRPIGLLIDQTAALLGELSDEDLELMSNPSDPTSAIKEFGLSEEIAAEGIRQIANEVCLSPFLNLRSLEVYTQNGMYSREPWVQKVEMQFPKEIPNMVSAGKNVTLGPLDFAYVGHPFMHHGPWDLSFKLTPEATTKAGFSDFSIYVWNTWDISNEGNFFRWPSDGNAAGPACQIETLYLDALSRVRQNLLLRAFE